MAYIQECSSWHPRPGCNCHICRSGPTGIAANHLLWRERKQMRQLPQPPTNFQYGVRCSCATCQATAQAEAEMLYPQPQEMAQSFALPPKKPCGCGCAHCTGKHSEMEMWDEVLDELSPSSITSAVNYNRDSATRLGWGAYQYDIVDKVLRLNFSPDESYFAELVADWQAANGLTPDGKIGTGTWGKMKAILGLGGGSSTSTGGGGSSSALRIPLVDTAMPAGSTYTVSNSSRKYGTPDTIRALKWIADEWHKLYPDVRFGVNDISQRGGGKLFKSDGRTPAHSSHRAGLDADVTLTLRSTSERIGQNRRGSPVEIVKDYAAYQHIARDFVALVLQNPALKIKTIFFFDRSLSPAISRSKDSNDHYKHFHLRFCMPPHYAAQMNLGAVYASGETKPNYNC